ACVVDVGEVDDGGDQVGIDRQRLAVGRRRVFHVAVIAVVQLGAFDEVLGGERGLGIREGKAVAHGDRARGPIRRQGGERGGRGTRALSVRARAEVHYLRRAAAGGVKVELQLPLVLGEQRPQHL